MIYLYELLPISCPNIHSYMYLLSYFFADCQIATILNGAADLTNGTTYGTVAPVTCEDGYNLTGANAISCLETGLWSSDAACVIIGRLSSSHI